jgi:hypothetical protein
MPKDASHHSCEPCLPCALSFENLPNHLQAGSACIPNLLVIFVCVFYANVLRFLCMRYLGAVVSINYPARIANGIPNKLANRNVTTLCTIPALTASISSALMHSRYPTRIGSIRKTFLSNPNSAQNPRSAQKSRSAVTGMRYDEPDATYLMLRSALDPCRGIVTSISGHFDGPWRLARCVVHNTRDSFNLINNPRRYLL